MENLYSYIQKNAENNGSKPAIIFKNTIISYSELYNRIQQVKLWIINKKITKGKIGFIFLPQTPESIIFFFGLMAAGVIPSFMPLPSHKQDNKKYWGSHEDLIKITDPSVIITTSEWTSIFEKITESTKCSVLDVKGASDLPEDISIDSICHDQGSIKDTAFLQHSSGTTGLKKGVALSHYAVIEQIRSYAKALSSKSDDVLVTWLPMYHDMGLIACTIMPLVLGQTIVLMDPFEWVSKPISLFQEITKYKGTLVWLPNFSFEHLRRTVKRKNFEDLDLNSVRAFINCSEPCKPETFDKFSEHFRDIGVSHEKLQVCYAMAETVYAVSQTKLGHKVSRIWVDNLALLENEIQLTQQGSGTQLLSCGHIIDGCKVDILNPDSEISQSVPTGKVGEIVISGKFLFNGYYKRPDKTNKVFDGTYYRTRDLGFIHNGELYVLGRKDDLIISNGRNYYAHEIEHHVNTLPNIKPGRNVALGVFNEEIGSNEVYLIQERDKSQSDCESFNKELIRTIRQTIQENMGLLLRNVFVVEAGWLHKSSSGKISRELNKQKLLNYLDKDL